MFQNAVENIGTFLLWMGGLLINGAFIATFLFFTLVIWIGMSGQDREPVSSFSRAGFIALIATVFIFAVITE
jgi:hypothetical protein